MKNDKPLWKSKTIWAGILLAGTAAYSWATGTPLSVEFITALTGIGFVGLRTAK